MCHDLLTETEDLVDEGDFTGHGWDGSGIRMGVWAGGRLEPRSQAAVGGNYSFPGFDSIGSTATLRLNQLGERYSNEGFGCHVLAAIPGARQPDGLLNISEGSCYNFVRGVAENSSASIEHLKQDILNSPVAYTDATVIKENGMQTYVRNMSNKKTVVYSAQDRKTVESIGETACIKDYMGTLMADHETAVQYHYGRENAECNVHLSRYCRKNDEETNHQWSRDIMDHLYKIKGNCSVQSEAEPPRT